MRQPCRPMWRGGGADASIGPRALETLGTPLVTPLCHLPPHTHQAAAQGTPQPPHPNPSICQSHPPHPTPPHPTQGVAQVTHPTPPHPAQGVAQATRPTPPHLTPPRGLPKSPTPPHPTSPRPGGCPSHPPQPTPPHPAQACAQVTHPPPHPAQACAQVTHPSPPCPQHVPLPFHCGLFGGNWQRGITPCRGRCTGPPLEPLFFFCKKKGVIKIVISTNKYIRHPITVLM